ncbi:MAG: GNAT family N-acetyltransferase [Anaerolinea sp.]|nr:GNAT family N-acetyltransferase [Anaerolinea sp.]
MPAFGVRPANKSEIKTIVAWFIQERSKDARFAQMNRSAWQRFMMRTWVLPRYLRSQANTFVLEQDGRTAGFAVVEQAGEWVTLSEFSIDAGFDGDGLLRALLRTTEELARDREYRYARVAPLDNSPPRLALFRSAGYELVDYYLWSFTGELAGQAATGGVELRALNPKEGLQQRTAALKEELDASQVAERAMIEESLFPRRPSPHPSYAIALAGGEAGAGQTIGYLSLRPNERDDGVLSIALSLAPAYWGAPVETQIVAAVVHDRGDGQAIPVRVMISTSAHADRSEAPFVALGLKRTVDDRPILSKIVQPAQPDKPGL